MTAASDFVRKFFPDGPAELYADILAAPDPQGWFSNIVSAPALVDLIRPKLIIEVGSWKGSSAIAMASHAKASGLDTAVFCVDTWLGSEEHWLIAKNRGWLSFEHGRPQIYETFRANVAAAGLTDRITPICLPSFSAARVLAARNIRAELIYIDAAHDYESVLQDIRAFWPLRTEGGLLFGDDYPHPPLRQAVHDFADEHDLKVLHRPGERAFVYAETEERASQLLAGGFTLSHAANRAG